MAFDPEEYERAHGRGKGAKFSNLSGENFLNDTSKNTMISWNNFGSIPASINDITRSNFDFPNKTLTVIKIIGASLLGAGAAFIFDFIVGFVILCFTCGKYSSSMDSVFSVLSYIMIAVGALWGGTSVFLDNKQECEKINAELRLVCNYHIYYCKVGFYNTVVDDVLKSLNDNIGNISFRSFTNSMRGINLYEEASRYISNYMRNPASYNSNIRSFGGASQEQSYVNRCPANISADLRSELRRYIDANVDVFIMKSYKCLNNISSECGLLRGISVLRIVEGNVKVDTTIESLIKALPNPNYSNLVISNSVNESLLHSILSYDKQITEELFANEYLKFENLKENNIPQSIIGLLSSDSYILFMWYFAICGDEEKYYKASDLVKYFYDDSVNKSISLAGRICDYFRICNTGNNKDQNSFDLIKNVIEKYL